MATVRWDPKAESVAQVATIEVTAYDAATTYTVTVNSVELANVTGNTSTTQTAADLATDWNLSTHAYATQITASNSGANLTLTADVSEVPFTASGAVAGGNGTIGNLSVDTTPTGPHTLTEAGNWSTGAVPSDGDTIVFEDSAVSALWDIDGLTTGNHTLEVRATYTGSIGLDRGGYERDAAGGNTTTTAPEYRTRYLTAGFSRIEVGGHTGAGVPANSPRVLVDNDRGGASQTVIYSTRSTGDSANEAPVRLLYAHADADIDVRGGAISIGLDAAGETATVGDVTVQGGSAYLGPGVTLTNFIQRDGSSALDIGAATVTKVSVHGGRLEVEGDKVITTLDVWAGDVECATAGNVTTANARGGRLVFSSAEAHTVPTLNIYRGARVEYDPDVTTVTTLNLADDGRTSLIASDSRG